MKLATPVLALTASTLATATAQPAASNASAPPIAVWANASHEESRMTYCNLPERGVHGWFYDSLNNGPHACLGEPYSSWAMLNSYRSGGTENVHWKYTEDKKDGMCLVDWDWYAEDGKTLVTKIKGRLAVESDGRHWCALRVYRSGGVGKYQWAWCDCWG